MGASARGVIAGVLIVTLAGCTSTSASSPSAAGASAPVWPAPTGGAASIPATASPAGTLRASLPAEPVWTRVADQAAFADARIKAVAAGPNRYVAVGCSARPRDIGTCDALSWVSTDGVAWTRYAIPSASGISLDHVLRGAGYLAWADFDADAAAPFWASSDGVTWHRSAPVPGLADAMITSVVWTGDRYLAAAGMPGQPFLLWVSSDGLTWRRHADAGCPAPWVGMTTAEFVGPSLATVPASVGGPDVRLLAWLKIAEGSAYRSFAGRATDGRCWQWTEGAPSIASVATVGPTLVALGAEIGQPGTLSGPPLAAWTSSDGLDWLPSRLPDRYPWQWFTGPVAADGVLVALLQDTDRAFVWRSVDGFDWVEDSSGPDVAAEGRMPGMCADIPACPLRTGIAGLAWGPGGLIAVGSTGSGSGPSRAVVWTTQPTD